MKKMRSFIVFLLGSLVLAWSCTEKREATDKTDYNLLFLPEMEGLFNNYQRMHDLGEFSALADSLWSANRDLKASELFVQAAYVYWEAGQADSATIMMHRAIDQGMSNPNILEKFPRGRITAEGAAWDRLQARLDSIETQLEQLSNFGLETRAMETFWPYLEQALADTTKAREILRSYIFEGPQEVRDYYVVRYGSIDNMYGQMINASPGYYRYLSTRFRADSLQPYKKDILAAMRQFREYYPQAVFPKVYVVPGLLNSGGTSTEMGMFLGGDMYGKGPGMPSEELTEWQEGAVSSLSGLPKLTVHELMHFQQSYQDSINLETLLSAVIQEGVCDFLVELCFEEPMSNTNLDFLEDPANHDWIFGELKRDLMGWETDKWLYNGGSIQDRPHDLGYTVGYLICKSFYENQQDKQAAVVELLNTSDFRDIVRKSDYAFLLAETSSAFVE
jgi:hypothetical protein